MICVLLLLFVSCPLQAVESVNIAATLKQRFNAAYESAARDETRIFDWEHFEVDGEHYLAVGNPRHPHLVNQVEFAKVFSFDEELQQLVEHQSIGTAGLEKWEHFQVGEKHYLIGIFSNPSNPINTAEPDSVLYKLEGTDFVMQQAISSKDIRDWEHFTIGDTHFVMAMIWREGSRAQGYFTTKTWSKLYKFNVGSEKLEEVQWFQTYGGLISKHFDVDGHDYLVLIEDGNASWSYTSGTEYSWSMEYTSLYRYDPQTKRFVHHQTIPDSTKLNGNIEVFKVQGQVYLVGLQTGFETFVHRFDRSTQQFRFHQALDAHVSFNDLEYAEISGKHFLFGALRNERRIMPLEFREDTEQLEKRTQITVMDSACVLSTLSHFVVAGKDYLIAGASSCPDDTTMKNELFELELPSCNSFMGCPGGWVQKEGAGDTATDCCATLTATSSTHTSSTESTLTTTTSTLTSVTVTRTASTTSMSSTLSSTRTTFTTTTSSTISSISSTTYSSGTITTVSTSKTATSTSITRTSTGKAMGSMLSTTRGTHPSPTTYASDDSSEASTTEASTSSTSTSREQGEFTLSGLFTFHISGAISTSSIEAAVKEALRTGLGLTAETQLRVNISELPQQTQRRLSLDQSPAQSSQELEARYAVTTREANEAAAFQEAADTLASQPQNFEAELTHALKAETGSSTVTASVSNFPAPELEEVRRQGSSQNDAASTSTRIATTTQIETSSLVEAASTEAPFPTTSSSQATTTQVGPRSTEAVPALCDSFNCPVGYIAKISPDSSEEANVTICCENEKEKLVDSYSKALPRCRCSHNLSSLPRTADDNLSCETSTGNTCSDGAESSQALWSCFVADQLCEVRVPDCSAASGAEAYGGACSSMTTREACSRMVACTWAEPKLAVHWSCQAVASAPSLAARCQKQETSNACIQQLGCSWNAALAPLNPCGFGTYRPCSPSAESFTDEGSCGRFFSEGACNEQIACSWQPVDKQCLCPNSHFGDSCEEEVSQWLSWDGLCLKHKAALDLCHGLTLAVSQGDGRRKSEACEESSGCSAWLRVKSVAAVIYWSSVADIANDFVALVCSLVVLFWLKHRPALRHVIILLVVASFLGDVLLEAIVVYFAMSGHQDFENFVESYCFSQGSGYETVVELRDTIKQIRQNGLVMIAMAVGGMLAEILEILQVTMTKKKVFEYFDAVAVMVAVGEMAYGLFDFTTNTLDLLGGIDNIELDVVGLAKLEKGHVCVRRNPLLPAVTPLPVAAFPWLGLHPAWSMAWPAGVVLLGVLGSILRLTLCSSTGQEDDDEEDVAEISLGKIELDDEHA